MSYPVPSAIGGTLIRKVLGLLKKKQFQTPITGKLVIATSAGVDSMVLAHLVSRYGRNIVSPSHITLLHFDHGWRPESATTEKTLVEAFARELGVNFLHQKLSAHTADQKSENAEEDARLKRNEVYERIAKEKGAVIFTAHHLDDQVESIAWRFFRGELFEMRAGILFQDHVVVRPMLDISKSEIEMYAEQEGVPFTVDPTNSDSTFFRSWMRSDVFPMLAKHFPQIKQSLSSYLESKAFQPETHDLANAVGIATGQPLKRIHFEQLEKLLKRDELNAKLSLPGGYQLQTVEDGILVQKVNCALK